MRHEPSNHLGRRARVNLEAKFLLLTLFVAGLFLVVTNSSLVNNFNYMDTMTSHKLKSEFLRSTDTTPKPIQVARQEYEKLKREFLDSTGVKQEEDLTMTIITKSSDADTMFCACDIVSVDCLDSVNCIPKQATLSLRVTSLRDVATGILLRSLIKKTAKFEGHSNVKNSRVPMGKGFQYKTISAFQSWVKNNTLPSEHDPSPSWIFLKGAKKKYQKCKDNNLVGFQCYFTAINEREEFDRLEEEALAYNHHLLKTDHELGQHMLHQVQDIQTAVSEDKENEIHALDYLRMFSHILRMLFNRQQPLRELSRRTRVFNANEPEQSQKRSDAHSGFDVLDKTRTQALERRVRAPPAAPLRVSIHMRRADACMANGKLVQEPSPLDSVAQQFAQRKCYATSVYMDALQRVKDMMSKNDPTRRIEVYFSSDDAGSMLEEIERQFPDLYRSMTWHIHDFDRERFKYKGFVEGYDHRNHNLLGEAAAADLWLLSNGDVFIGHLGSRFGKVAYLLATARHNRFVPFFSVDGHSVCCEIDEPCGEMKPYIKSMSDCLTFSHDLASEEYGIKLDNEYFEVGSYMRKIVAEAKGALR